ncbi:MBL fold metallo-hydrolase [Methanomassiliicoccales archaeon RumEn M1]|nr:MBL fold metallo-hydrolase [Methanomassiliicoccales archaeon RumEn M1]
MIGRSDNLITFSFIARMPDDPGALHRAAAIIKSHGGNIRRVDYDRRIDPHTVFFEGEAPEGAPEAIRIDLQRVGYLQENLITLRFLKFHVYLPDEPGQLFNFLGHTTGVGVNIAFLDYDRKGKYPGRLTVSLTLENDQVADRLLEDLKQHYRLEILEYDSTGKRLDDTVFYIRFAQELREIIGEAEDEFLMRLLQDSNHIAQELTSRDMDPRVVFDSILQTGRTLRQTTEGNFYADVQKVSFNDGAELYCFQMPCGGSVYVLQNERERVMFDTGFGIYHWEIMDMLTHYGVDCARLSRIYITHADADHCGGAAMFDAPSVLHPGSIEIIRNSNRAYNSIMQSSILGEVYTKLINLFSHFQPPTRVEVLPTKPLRMRGELPVIAEFEAAGRHFEVLESLGGHLHGQVFFLAPDDGLLFTGDTMINFASFTPEREEFSSLADTLMTSVNVDSELARRERKALMDLAAEIDASLASKGRRLLLCCGHGAISTLEGKKLVAYGEIERYHSDPMHYPMK